MTHEPAPRVTVLMAAYNGRRWIDEQIDSVLSQEGIETRLVVSDDGSTDGTRERLVDRARADSRLTLLPPREGPPGVAENFLHLFAGHAPDGSHVAFCDQDDVWHPDKLRRQLALMAREGADVVSSNVTGFDEEGRRFLIRKSGPQRTWDHLFEAAGPGSTYVFSPSAHERLVGVLAELDHSGIGVHDWYLYALARAVGATWVIGEEPTLDYRQHSANVQGANSGAGALASRVSRLRSGFYAEQFLLTARAVAACNAYPEPVRADLAALIDELEGGGLGARLRFARRWRQIRRNPVEGLQLAAGRVLGIW
ncbi:glycosyltransferase family 2 protein [Actinomyces sp. B33]|uniref:glycosyltransferase family 2 protein n=1 Tax=Actinomyces sp. B33 TaxID=2942131 RepID=UPI00233FB823|nr:glycosyltransferase family 2 protein [Actinomyces sp. B33]MDC4232659.1 glycosyltransferase family 2 protein [Actinomyces sp. B33]